MRRVAILIALLVLFAGAIRVASDAYEHRSHKALAEPDRGLRMAAMDRLASEQPAAVSSGHSTAANR
jgi:hypothetical protein